MMKRHWVCWVTGAILLGSGLGLLYGCASDEARSSNLLRLGDGGIDLNETCPKDIYTPVLAGPCGLIAPEFGGTNPDEFCNKSNASTWKECSRDCITHCGFNALGTKVCTCRDGFYTGCPCFKPADWGGAPTAPLCDTPNGASAPLKGNPCTREWQQCIGTEPVPSTSPQACVCLKADAQGSLAWSCGSTNSWFELDISAG
jgi:hypothetical protein